MDEKMVIEYLKRLREETLEVDPQSNLITHLDEVIDTLEYCV